MTFKGIIYFYLVWTLSIKATGQINSDSSFSDIVYEQATEDYFKEYKNANLIVDYYFTDGWSLGDRYSYEIIIIDSLLFVAFNSPDSDSFAPISFQKKRLVTKLQLDHLKSVLINSNLKQTKEGIPRPTFSAHTQEVLIVKYNGINITGGMGYGNIASYEVSQSEKEINQSILNDRKQSSSIGGNYDGVIQIIKKYFFELDKLKKRSSTTK